MFGEWIIISISALAPHINWLLVFWRQNFRIIVQLYGEMADRVVKLTTEQNADIYWNVCCIWTHYTNISYIVTIFKYWNVNVANCLSLWLKYFYKMFRTLDQNFCWHLDCPLPYLGKIYQFLTFFVFTSL